MVFKRKKKLRVSIGIAAYNEENNIARLLDSIITQKLSQVTITEIFIISSGSTDKTNDITKKYVKRYKKIKLVPQKKRLGKASAVNLLLSRAKEKIIILISADVILKQGTLEKLVIPLQKKDVGIVGSHPVPLNDPKTFFGFSAHLMWNLHHWISLTSPKMGECIAFRKTFKQIHVLTAVDEVNIESLIKGQGYKAIYEPKAIIYNKGPENLKEFITARRRIYVGHLSTMYEYSYEVSTIGGIKILLLLGKHFQLSWRYIFWTPLVILLEMYSRLLGYMDYRLYKRSHTIWEVTKSTKKLPRFKEATL
jgi:cellulose synthase/poly-beta-1,6-N-acetylglucosamine synthase-like glycosyltransferase